MELIDKNLEPASTSLIWEKTIIITCISDDEILSLTKEVKLAIPELVLDIRNLSNVFTANKLDIGVKSMLENIPKGNFKSIIDLDCGNGVLGMDAKQLYKHIFTSLTIQRWLSHYPNKTCNSIS